MGFNYLIHLMCLTIVLVSSGSFDEKSCAKVLVDSAQLSEQTVTKLEMSLKTDPDNALTRLQLLCYYFYHQLDGPQTNAARSKHLVWMIHHHPGSVMAGPPYCLVNPTFDPEGFKSGWKEWQQQIRKNPHNVAILRNAASYAQMAEDGEDIQLLESIHKLLPDDPKILEDIGCWYYSEAHAFAGEQRKEAAHTALNYFLPMAAKLKSSEICGPTLFEIAYAAFWDNQDNLAVKYANILLGLAERDPNEDFARYHGNLVLGQLALRKSDIKRAVANLQASVKGKQGQTFTFDPGLDLASELLKKGERTAVADFLKALRARWPFGQDKIDNWIDEIGRGLEPDFDDGKHLKHPGGS